MINITVKNQPDRRYGQLSDFSGIEVDTIHHYQNIGLLKKSMVENSMEISTTVRCIKFIRRAQKFGFSINEIKNILNYFR
jgi:DNA-binding transcriptional MerR regulator